MLVIQIVSKTILRTRTKKQKENEPKEKMVTFAEIYAVFG
jgi:hypothetical protein